MNYLETYEAIEKLAMAADGESDDVLAPLLREALDHIWSWLTREERAALNARGEVKP